MDLRKLVGHRTLIQTAGSIIIENEQGQILLGRRTDNHLWGYSGGSIEIDERVEECARRELFEETGLVPDEMELFMINSGPEIHYIYPNGDEVSNVEIIYICRHFHGQMKRQKEEMEELRFFDPADVTLDMISPPIRPVLRRYLEMKQVLAPQEIAADDGLQPEQDLVSEDDRTFRPGDLVQHFKRETVDPATRKYLYRIVGVATHSESREPMMVYQALYDDGGMYVRPLDMFLSEVDREKYPEIRQKYRFARIR